MAQHMFLKGDKVMGLGRGSTTWPDKPLGTVTDLFQGYVRVWWDGTGVEDDMLPTELLPVYWVENLNRYVTIPED